MPTEEEYGVKTYRQTEQGLALKYPLKESHKTLTKFLSKNDESLGNSLSR